VSSPARPILVTGGAGFIGQNLVRHLLQQTNSRIVILDALTYASNPTQLTPLMQDGRLSLVHGDIVDRELVKSLFDQYAFDTVLHLAAESHVDRSISAPDVFVRTNVLGTHNLLMCALENWQSRGVLDTARFVHVSTDEVFGDLDYTDPPFTENSPYRPSSPYSASKAASDHMARAYQRTYGLPVIVTNCSNNYGPCQHPEKLMPLMIIRCLEGKSLPVYGDGANVRDWLFVKDHCRAITLALSKGVPGGTYNIGGGTEQTNKNVVEKICDLIDRRFRDNPALAQRYPHCPAASGKSCRDLITFVTDRPGHDRRYAIDPSFAKGALGYVPEESFETGLLQTIDWYLENETWWRTAMSPNFHDWIRDNYGSRDTQPASHT